MPCAKNPLAPQSDPRPLQEAIRSMQQQQGLEPEESDQLRIRQPSYNERRLTEIRQEIRRIEQQELEVNSELALTHHQILRSHSLSRELLQRSTFEPQHYEEIRQALLRLQTSRDVLSQRCHQLQRESTRLMEQRHDLQRQQGELWTDIRMAREQQERLNAQLERIRVRHRGCGCSAADVLPISSPVILNLIPSEIIDFVRWLASRD